MSIASRHVALLSLLLCFAFLPGGLSPSLAAQAKKNVLPKATAFQVGFVRRQPLRYPWSLDLSARGVLHKKFAALMPTVKTASRVDIPDMLLVDIDNFDQDDAAKWTAAAIKRSKALAAKAKEGNATVSVNDAALAQSLTQQQMKTPSPTLNANALTQAPVAQPAAPAPNLNAGALAKAPVAPAPNLNAGALAQAPVAPAVPATPATPAAPGAPAAKAAATPPGEAPGKQVAALTPKPPVTTPPAAESGKGQQGPITTLTSPEAVHASESFKKFCTDFVQHIDSTYDKGSATNMKIEKRGSRFVARYMMVDKSSVSLNIKPTEYPHTPFVGILVYSEQLLEAEGDTAQAAKTGQFKVVDTGKVREFFRYANKKWQF